MTKMRGDKYFNLGEAAWLTTAQRMAFSAADQSPIDCIINRSSEELSFRLKPLSAKVPSNP